MDYNLLSNIEYCKEFVSDFTTLLYYSHIPTAIITLLVGFFVLIRNHSAFLAKLLFSITVAFLLWAVFDLSIWLNYDQNSLLMFAWAPIEMFSVLLFILCLYFVYVYTEKRDISIGKKIIFTILLLPVIILTPTVFNLTAYDIQECIAIENSYYLLYIKSIKIFISLWIVVLSIVKFIKAKTAEDRKQISILALGILAFILSFSVAGFISEYTGDYRYEIYGLFGMILFIGSLSYLIVRFKAFNIKLLGAQALVIALISLIGSQFFYIQNSTNKILNGIALLLSIGFGFLLVKSVKKEVDQREKIEKLNERLEGLIHFISHEVKGYLTKSQAVFASMVDGDLGVISTELKDVAEVALKDNRAGVDTIMTILNSSNVKKGTMKFKTEPFDMKVATLDVVGQLKPVAEAKRLTIDVQIEDGNFIAVGDKEEIAQHVIRNLIDNSIKYTLQGGLVVSLKNRNGKILLSIKDTGVGIKNSDKERLFTEGGRGEDSRKINVSSTGYGLFFAKGIVDAHSGRIWAESEGEGKGSTFFVELPQNK